MIVQRELQSSGGDFCCSAEQIAPSFPYLTVNVREYHEGDIAPKSPLVSSFPIVGTKNGRFGKHLGIDLIGRWWNRRLERVMKRRSKFIRKERLRKIFEFTKDLELVVQRLEERLSDEIGLSDVVMKKCNRAIFKKMGWQQHRELYRVLI